VRARSRKDFAPAHTVTTGCDASASRSAETSPLSSTPRCTPPMPPVANTSMPARCASATLAETVVTPTSQPCAAATARSRSATLRVPSSTRSSSASLSPTRHCPSSTAVTAGTAPPSCTAAVQRRSASALCGTGRPSVE
jgi:hypothetical protein